MGVGAIYVLLLMFPNPLLSGVGRVDGIDARADMNEMRSDAGM
jgi:hypothetical protein